MMKIRFGVYEHIITYGDGEILTRSIIVLKDADDDIVGWTDFHRYAKSRKNSLSKSIHSDPNKSCKNIVMFLNYSFFDKYNVKKLNDITNDMVRDFLTDYGLCRLPYDENTHRGKETVDCCIKNIINFVSSLKKNNPDAKVNPSDLFTTEQVFSKRKKRYFSVEIPTFEVNYNPSSNKIFRDITEGAFQIIMDEILINHTNILMLAALGAFAGLRPSEACNVRRADSVLGAGIIFKTVDGEVTDIIIDLKKERILRSDMVDVGGIKKEREQKVYPAFLKVFIDCYNTYMKYIEGHRYEYEYGALTNTSFGKAYTYEAYYKEFKNVIRACIPKMLESDNPETVNYGHLLLENSISPHVFRHWFSVKLALYGEDVSGLMNWRGDKSPESALTYLQNKGELEKIYGTVSEEVFNYSLWKASKIVKEKNGKFN